MITSRVFYVMRGNEKLVPTRLAKNKMRFDMGFASVDLARYVQRNVDAMETVKLQPAVRQKVDYELLEELTCEYKIPPSYAVCLEHEPGAYVYVPKDHGGCKCGIKSVNRMTFFRQPVDENLGVVLATDVFHEEDEFMLLNCIVIQPLNEIYKKDEAWSQSWWA